MAFTTPPPKQNPTAPILPLVSLRVLRYGTALTKSSIIFARSCFANISRALSSSPG